MCDLDYRNINLLTFFKTGRENLSCHFPRREIHDSDYYNVFLKFVFKNISDLEIHIEKSDVEKAFEENADFVMCLLGYEKNDHGIDGLRDSIERGTIFKHTSMLQADCCSFTFVTNTLLYGSDKKRHEAKTIWRMDDDDLSVWFVGFER